MGKKISQLVELDILSGNEEMPVRLGTENYKVKLSFLSTLINLASLGLDQVDNTSDVNKPLSIAAIAALSGKAPLVHTHPESDVTGLVQDLANITTALAGKASINHTHGIAGVIGLQAELDNKASLNHIHTVADITGLDTYLNNFTFTINKSDVTGLVQDLNNIMLALANKADINHSHSIADIIGLQSALNSKADINHTHVAAGITDLTPAVISIIQNNNIPGIGDVIVGALNW